MSGGSATRACIVTGATGGIGRAVCLRLVRDGYHVVAVDLAAARLDELVSEMGNASAAPVDLAQPDECERFVAEVTQRDDLHGAVLCAAIMTSFDPATQTPATFDQDHAEQRSGGISDRHRRRPINQRP